MSVIFSGILGEEKSWNPLYTEKSVLKIHIKKNFRFPAKDFNFFEKSLGLQAELSAFLRRLLDAWRWWERRKWKKVQILFWKIQNLTWFSVSNFFAVFQMADQREQNVYTAKLAEQAERYDGIFSRFSAFPLLFSFFHLPLFLKLFLLHLQLFTISSPSLFCGIILLIYYFSR